MKISSPSNIIFCTFLLLSITFLNSCSGGLDGKVVEGRIEYDVTYPGLDPNNMMAAGLPDKATYKFKKLSSITEFSGMMGLIHISYISDGEKRTAKQTLNLIDKKYVSDLNFKQVQDVNKEFVKEIKLADGNKEIAGHKCKKAMVTLNDGTTIEAWYTTEIGMDSINWCNPYTAIKGVMMEFQMVKYGVTMKLVAKSFTKEEIADIDFNVPADFKTIDIGEQNKILEDLNPVSSPSSSTPVEPDTIKVISPEEAEKKKKE